MKKKNTLATKLMDLAKDLHTEKRTDRQRLTVLAKQHPTWSRERIADTYGLSVEEARS